MLFFVRACATSLNTLVFCSRRVLSCFIHKRSSYGVLRTAHNTLCSNKYLQTNQSTRLIPVRLLYSTFLSDLTDVVSEESILTGALMCRSPALPTKIGDDGSTIVSAQALHPMTSPAEGDVGKGGEGYKAQDPHGSLSYV